MGRSKSAASQAVYTLGGRCWWVYSDPCGVVCANFTVFLLLFAEFTMVRVILGPWYGYSSLPVVGYTLLTALALISHTRCQYTDPGAVPAEFKPPVNQKAHLEQHDHHLLLLSDSDDESATYSSSRRTRHTCPKCETIKPTTAHHCSTCQRCVMRMDHHCPWVNNCVGWYNQRYFLLFLAYTCLCCILVFVLLIARFVACTSGGRNRRTRRQSARELYSPSSASTCRFSSVDLVLCILTFVESVMFGLFTGVMLSDQIYAVSENTPGIDAMQGIQGEAQPLYDSLCSVMGGRFGLAWFVPFSTLPALRKEFMETVRRFHGRLQWVSHPVEPSDSPPLRQSPDPHALVGGSHAFGRGHERFGDALVDDSSVVSDHVTRRVVAEPGLPNSAGGGGGGGYDRARQSVDTDDEERAFLAAEKHAVAHQS